MIKGLFLYPNYPFDNPTSNQFERLLLSLKGLCETHLLALPGPRQQKAHAVSSMELIQGYNRYSAYKGEFIKHHLGALATIPDELRWNVNPLMYRTACKLLEDKANRYDFILTLSFPLSCHLVGEKLKRRYGLPWIALFYDPWTDNLHRVYTSSLYKQIDAKLEKEVAQTADACLFTNKAMSSIWKDKYRGRNTFTVPFCYSQQMMNHQIARPSFNNSFVRMLYAGLSNEKRNLKDMIRAVGELMREGYPGTRRLRIRIAGNIFDSDRALVESEGLQSIFSFVGMLSQEELKNEFLSTDIFIVSDAPGRVNVHIPSKLMDYFFYRRPIVGLTPSIGGTADELRASGNTIIENGDIPSIKNYLKEVLDNGLMSLNYDDEYYKCFSPESVSAQFMKIVKSVIE